MAGDGEREQASPKGVANGWPPLSGDASVVLAMRRHAAENGWPEEELRRRAEAARRKISAIRAAGGEVRNPAGFGLTLIRTMAPEEVKQFLEQDPPKPRRAWWEGKLDKSQEALQERERARQAALASQNDAQDDDEHEARRRAVCRGQFDAQSNMAARRRLLGAQHALLPGGVARRVFHQPPEEDSTNDD
jgi:hypothetical protein